MVVHARHQVVEQVHQRVVGPMDVLEHQQQRLREREVFHEPPRRELQVDHLAGRSYQPQRAAPTGIAGLGDLALGEQRGHGPRASAGHLDRSFS